MRRKLNKWVSPTICNTRCPDNEFNDQIAFEPYKAVRLITTPFQTNELCVVEQTHVLPPPLLIFRRYTILAIVSLRPIRILLYHKNTSPLP
jgi:hypothetical protein